eukprot:g15372.t1
MGAGAVAACAATAAAVVRPGRPAKGSPGRHVGRTAASALNPDNFSDVCDQTGVTLNRYMIEANRQGVVDTDILSVMNSIREATKVISKLVNTAPLAQAELLGLEGAINVQGEDQKKLDVITNDVLKKALMLESEESNAVCDLPANIKEGAGLEYVELVLRAGEEFLCFAQDLDGDQVSCLAATLQPGKALVAAGYVLYSCSTELVFTLGRGVVGFTLDSSIGEYVLTRPSIEIPSRGKIYSCNEVYASHNGMDIRAFIKSMKDSGLLDEHFTKVDADLAFFKCTARHTRKIGLEDL